jgi:hypothetical protein
LLNAELFIGELGLEIAPAPGVGILGDERVRGMQWRAQQHAADGRAKLKIGTR